MLITPYAVLADIVCSWCHATNYPVLIGWHAFSVAAQSFSLKLFGRPSAWSGAWTEQF